MHSSTRTGDAIHPALHGTSGSSLVNKTSISQYAALLHCYRPRPDRSEVWKLYCTVKFISTLRSVTIEVESTCRSQTPSPQDITCTCIIMQCKYTWHHRTAVVAILCSQSARFNSRNSRTSCLSEKHEYATTSLIKRKWFISSA